MADLNELALLGFEVRGVKHSFWDSFGGLIRALFSELPFQSGYFSSRKFKKLVDSEVKSGKYQIAYFHLIRSIQFLPSNMGKTKAVVDFTDAVSLYLTNYVAIEKNLLKRMFFKWELSKIKVYEKHAESFSRVYVCSENDRQFLNKRYPNISVRLLENGIDTEMFCPNYEMEREKGRIIFTGNIPYFANHDAILYFCDSIFPEIEKQNPEVSLYIVGQNPTPKVLSLAKENIIITGFVKDIKQEYLKSKVNIAPIRFGAGTLNKILESIALGVPVVATSLAVQGFDPELKKYVFIADTADDFANQVIRLMEPSEPDQNLIREGSEYIRGRLSWKKIVSAFSRDLAEIVELN